MLENFQRLFESQAKVAGTVVHVGAGVGGDLPYYHQLGFKHIYLVEPCEEQAKVLKKKAEKQPEIHVLEKLVAAKKGVFEFSEFGNPSFCALDLPEALKYAYPNVQLIRKLDKQAITLDELLADKKLIEEEKNLLVLELMGEEVPLLRDVKSTTLDQLDWIVLNLLGEKRVENVAESLIREGYECVGRCVYISPFLTVIFKKSVFHQSLEKERIKNETLEKDLYKNRYSLQSCLRKLENNKVSLKKLRAQEENYLIQINCLESKLKNREKEFLDYKLTHRKKKVIVVGTMPRSGSTWLYNCVKKVLAFGDDSVCSDWVEDYKSDNNAHIHVIKAHDPGVLAKSVLHVGVDLIISSRRDIREVAASLKRMGWAKSDGAFLGQMKWIVDEVHEYWYKNSNLEVEFNEIEQNPDMVVDKISRLLGISLSEFEVAAVSKELDELDNPKKYDRETQMHPFHRSKENLHYSNILTSSEIKVIENTFSDWMKKFKYSSSSE